MKGGVSYVSSQTGIIRQEVKIMQKKQRVLALIIIMQFIVTLTLFLPLHSIADADQPPALIEWQLSDTKVVSRGTLATAPEGKIRTGIKITGKAVSSIPGAIFSEGVFNIVMTAFIPNEDMAGQKKGSWYIRGKWTITATGADPADLKPRYNPYSMTGLLSTSLPFDPSVENGNMVAQVTLQRGGTRPRTGRMPAGSYSGKSNFEGKLTTPFIPSVPKGKKTPV